jgi:endonuclease-3
MKKAFDIPDMLQKAEQAVSSYPKAAMFELYEKGYTSLFEQLVSCIISIRTLDETTIPVSEKLFAKARTPEQMLLLTPEHLEKMLDGSQYPGQKAYTILGIARAAVNDFNGLLPADYDHLIALKGVGPKCARLALGIASGQAGISVDVHVHRVVNRWELLQTKKPEESMARLEAIIDRKHWIDINRILMPFGKHVCVLHAPFCSACPLLSYCRQVGVTKHR